MQGVLRRVDHELQQAQWTEKRQKHKILCYD